MIRSSVIVIVYGVCRLDILEYSLW